MGASDESKVTFLRDPRTGLVELRVVGRVEGSGIVTERVLRLTREQLEALRK